MGNLGLWDNTLWTNLSKEQLMWKLKNKNIRYCTCMKLGTGIDHECAAIRSFFKQAALCRDLLACGFMQSAVLLTSSQIIGIYSAGVYHAKICSVIQLTFQL
jgi:hypothetical protein